jgi:hypothetical protein
MRTTSILVAALAFGGCTTADDEPRGMPMPPRTDPARKERPIEGTPLVFVGDPVKQAADFPKETWVRTTTFDGKPFLGFTYTDPSKGNSIKGMATEGVSDEDLSKTLNGPPGITMSPIPEGHALTPLTPEEVAKLKLPSAPEWLSFYR